MNSRIITSTAWACALAVVFYRRALVPLTLLALDALTSSQVGPCDSIPPECWSGHDLPGHLSSLFPPARRSGRRATAILGLKGNRSRAQLLERLRNSPTTSSQAPPAAPVPALGEGLTNAEIKAMLGLKGNRSRAQLLERLKQKLTDDYEDSLVKLASPLPIRPHLPIFSLCTIPPIQKTSRSSTAESWTSSAPAKTPIAATTSPASSAMSNL